MSGTQEKQPPLPEQACGVSGCRIERCADPIRVAAEALDQGTQGAAAIRQAVSREPALTMLEG